MRRWPISCTIRVSCCSNCRRALASRRRWVPCSAVRCLSRRAIFLCRPATSRWQRSSLAVTAAGGADFRVLGLAALPDAPARPTVVARFPRLLFELLAAIRSSLRALPRHTRRSSHRSGERERSVASIVSTPAAHPAAASSSACGPRASDPGTGRSSLRAPGRSVGCSREGPPPDPPSVPPAPRAR